MRFLSATDGDYQVSRGNAAVPLAIAPLNEDVGVDRWQIGRPVAAWGLRLRKSSGEMSQGCHLGQIGRELSGMAH